MKSIFLAFASISILCAGGVRAESASTEELLLEAQQLMSQSAELQAKRNYTASIAPAARAVEIREKHLGSRHLDTAAALDRLGRGYRLAGDYSRAEPAILRALAIREKTLGSNHLATAASLNNLGGLYFSTFRYREAKPYYVRALSIRERTLGPDHIDTLLVVNNLGQLYSRMGPLSVADTLLHRALNGFERNVGENELFTSDALTNMAYLSFIAGRDHEAEAELTKALAIRERILGPDNQDIAIPLSTLALQHLVTGDFGTAKQLYVRAIEITEKSGGSNHIYLSRLLSGLALVHVQMGNYERAESLYQRALEIEESSLGDNNLGNAYLLDDIGELRIATHRFDKAETILKRAVDLKRALGTKHESVASSLHKLAIASEHLGKSEEAKALFQDALQIRERVLGLAHPRTATSLIALSELCWATGGHRKALSLFQRAEAIQLQNSSRFLLSGSEMRKRAYLQTVSTDTDKYVSFSTTASDLGTVSLGLNSVLQYKGRVLDVMSDSTTRLRLSVQPEDRELFEQLSKVVNQISTLAYRGPSDFPLNEYGVRFEALRIQEEKLQTQLSARSSEFHRQVTPVTAAEVRRAIPENAALVEWFRYARFDPKTVITDSPAPASSDLRYIAYVIKRNSDPVAIDVGDALSIDALVNEFRLAASKPDGDLKAVSRALYERLWSPLSDRITGVERVLVSPDGALNLLPMAALLDDHGEYLAKRFEITELTSGRDLLRFDSRPHSQGGIVVVADANFGNVPNFAAAQSEPTPAQRSVELDADLDRGGLFFRPLPNTALEAAKLKELLGLDGESVLLRDDASESNLKKLHGPRILHIASHGFFLSDKEMAVEAKNRGAPDQSSALLRDNPLIRSGIALAGANIRRFGQDDDGVLTALEVAQLDLQGTELVVLSACDSGIGDVQNGEGVYGLRRALVLAGAQTQVTSLWKVSDDATKKLMIEYYKRLLAGEGRSAALRHSQLTMLNNPAFSHPYYWASFVSIGNWAPIPSLQSVGQMARAH